MFPSGGSWSFGVGLSAARRLLPSVRFPSGEWRNRQTRRIQDPVQATGWGFNSPLAHFVRFVAWRSH
jgi:hypothetical protein